jgi:hypothetical protein
MAHQVRLWLDRSRGPSPRHTRRQTRLQSRNVRPSAFSQSLIHQIHKAK